MSIEFDGELLRPIIGQDFDATGAVGKVPAGNTGEGGSGNNDEIPPYDPSYIEAVVLGLIDSGGGNVSMKEITYALTLEKQRAPQSLFEDIKDELKVIAAVGKIRNSNKYEYVRSKRGNDRHDEAAPKDEAEDSLGRKLQDALGPAVHTRKKPRRVENRRIKGKRK